MSSDIAPQLRLQPEHLGTLAAFEGGRVIGARLCRSGRFDPVGFTLYGRLEVLANCGLVEFLARDGARQTPPGDVLMYYYLTDRGRDLLRWRMGETPAGLNPQPPSPRYGSALPAAHTPRT